MQSPKSILITGASSGLGAALADHYAAPGITLFLGGRHRPRLDNIAEACRAKGAMVDTALIDVASRAAMADWIARSDARAPLDLVIANAGISGGSGGDGSTDGGTLGAAKIESAQQARRIFRVNVSGVANTVLPAIDLMRAHPQRAQGRGKWSRGQIAVMSSLASFRGMPGAPAYCASKAAVRSWGEGLRGTLAAEHIELSVICPGFIRTPMTAVNPFPMPFLMDPQPAAEIIAKGLRANKARIAFPFRLYALVWLLAALSPGFTDRFLTKLPGKPSDR